ncbi:hypothetical protein KVV02_005141 [Mortierella alpina]|uniref:Uncharacterized protein n=1 Tax=Mortierella alpina TaxID=64518 RepID=A0A9P7ZXR2_MORAP|nr:hypothetical protein KVV02_005141 [Mortierella alpina]
MILFPTEAQVYLRRIAYIPVSDKWRDYIVENSTVVHSPLHCIRFHKTSLLLEKIKKPVMQLHVTTRGKRSKAGTFTRPIYVATFDALWHFKDSSDRETKRTTGESVVKQVSIVKQELMAARASMHESVPEAAPRQEAMAVRSLESPMNQATTKTQKATWWKTVYFIFWLKCRLRTHTYVTFHSSSLEYLFNPALSALVEYKWNTIGFVYWAFRFSFHCLFYGLVIAAALLQIYHENVRRTQLAGVSVAIIVLGSAFLWLELVQAIRNFKRYRLDWYNIFDIVTYTLPMVAAYVILADVRDDSAKALINVAFANSDDGFSLIESRMHYIELAENLSYHIPGFRQTHDWFPKEIYYCATAREIQMYEETLREAGGEAKGSVENDPAMQVLREQVQDLKHQLVSQQEREKRRFQELKDLLLGRAENHKAGAVSGQ